ncbi:hypothetical protein GTY67_34355 [Streptomyces sp. SID8374]|uniref:hypothetical protein n=1 Tax=Streptomyces sp. SID8374 TaxID=2690354 RepID=UPI001370F126|nr:hypothetical protein [Streptomyces sp. SID8374]MYX18433.1 hypothetical protein [Streptomyces sp. SID8374]
MADTAPTTRQLLAQVLEKVTTNPDEWSVKDTETISRLSRAAEYEEAAEKVASVRTGGWPL